MKGIIKTLPVGKSFAFIYVPGHPEFFVHAGALVTGLAWGELEKGDWVEFEPEYGNEKGPRAVRVKLLGKAGDYRPTETTEEGGAVYEETENGGAGQTQAAATPTARYGGRRDRGTRGRG
jgi:cold shock CspA family protein